MTDRERETELERFFQERLVPAAEKLRERDVSFFALEPDRTAQSYWKARPHGEGYVFQIGDLGGELHELWRGYPELQALVNDLVAMTSTMAEQREQSADVSSFIYAMF